MVTLEHRSEGFRAERAAASLPVPDLLAQRWLNEPCPCDLRFGCDLPGRRLRPARERHDVLSGALMFHSEPSSALCHPV